jgi:hypothetical protein
MKSKVLEANQLQCEVCDKIGITGEDIHVACVPGVPYSAAYCIECLQADAHPWGILIANTACCDGLHNTADWWKWMVTDTCDHLDRSLDEFIESVEISMKAIEEDMKRRFEKQSKLNIEES